MNDRLKTAAKEIRNIMSDLDIDGTAKLAKNVVKINVINVDQLQMFRFGWFLRHVDIADGEFWLSFSFDY